MKFKTQICSIVFILGIISCTVNKKATNGAKTKYIMDMVYNNLGLPPRVSEFNNPEYVKGVGFNGMAPHWYVQCGITYDSLKKGIVAENSDERIWINKNAATLNNKIKEVKNAGIKLYPFTGFLVIPKSVWQKYGIEMVADEFRNQVETENYRKTDIRKEMTQKIMRIQIAEIFETFPDLDGLMLRFGETYLHDTPYHLGNSPVRSKGVKAIRFNTCLEYDTKNMKVTNRPDFDAYTIISRGQYEKVRITNSNNSEGVARRIEKTI